MGGGGAIRAATKVATYGINAGIRGATATLPSRPVSAAVLSPSSSTASEDVKTSGLILKNEKNEASGSGLVQTPAAWDEWDFADDEEELLLNSIDPSPRLVFGGAPTLEEAREATSDLKEALEKEYFSQAIDRTKSSTVEESAPLRSGKLETKACITSENALFYPSVPTPVFHAFSLLKESPEAQGVVASLASDKNVWEAVMQNAKVMEFIKKQQDGASSDNDINLKHPISDSHSQTEGVDSKESGNEFMEFVEKVKDKVKVTMTDIISSLSGFFQNIFGGLTEGNVSMDKNGNATVNTAMGASFMALAVLAIMVVVLKRV